MSKNPIRTLVIPAAGAGTRLLPISRTTPKEMLRLVDKPAIYYILEEAYLSGIRNTIIVINPWKKSIKEYFSDKNGDSLVAEFPEMHFSFIKTDDQFGDGHAIYLARKMIKDDFFAVSMADLLSPPKKEPFLKQLIKAQSSSGKPIISAEYVPKKHVDRYGIVVPGYSKNNLYEVRGIVEKPSIQTAPSNFAMTGKYVLPKNIFNYLGKLLKNRRNGQEVKLADALKEYAKTNNLLALACIGKHLDIGNKMALLKAELTFAMQDKNLGKEFTSFVRRERERI